MPTNFLRTAGTSNSGLLTSLVSLMTTELQSLANAATALSSVNGASGKFTNADTAQAQWGEMFFSVGNPGIGSAVVAGGNLTGWFMTSPDSGTTYEEDVSGSAIPRAPDFIIPLPATTITAAHVFKSGIVRVPALQFKVKVQNNTGQTFGNGGTTAPFLKLAPCADQY